MKSIYRLKKNYQYGYVYKHAESVSDKLFVVLYCKSNARQTKVGFSVSKKYGNAVCRNRIRRQMKSAVSSLMPEVSSGYNLIVIPRRQGDYRFTEIEVSLRKLFVKAGLINEVRGDCLT